MENEKIVSISMIASRNLKLKNREIELRSVEDENSKFQRENLKLQSKVISTTRQVDMLESQLRFKNKEMEQWKTLYLHSKEIITKLHNQNSSS
jgi:hypothetical protein